MKTNPTPESRGVRPKATKRALADSRSNPRSAPAPGDFGPTAFSHTNAVSAAETEILRIAKAIKQAGCRDLLIIYTPKFVRFIVTTKLPNSR